MAVGFLPDGGSLIPFAVDVSVVGTLLPIPELGDDGVRAWETDVILADGTDAGLLRAEQVRVTARPAIGGISVGTLILEGLNAGGDPGRFGDLTVPTDASGGEQTWRAALSSISLGGEMFSGVRRAHVHFFVGSRVS